MVDLLLYAPEYRPNLSNMIRSAEFFGLKRIYIYDKNKLMEPPHNKATRADMNHLARVWTAGAVDHITIISVDHPIEFMNSWNGRIVATMVDEQALPLIDYKSEGGDLIVMGPEKKGLPVLQLKEDPIAVYLPNQGITDCLNVSVMAGIMLYHATSRKG